MSNKLMRLPLATAAIIGFSLGFATDNLIHQHRRAEMNAEVLAAADRISAKIEEVAGIYFELRVETSPGFDDLDLSGISISEVLEDDDFWIGGYVVLPRDITSKKKCDDDEIVVRLPRTKWWHWRAPRRCQLSEGWAAGEVPRR